MKLRDQIDKVVAGESEKDLYVTDQFVEIAEDFAEKFAEWVGENHIMLSGKWFLINYCEDDEEYTTKELLTKFKDEVYGSTN